MATPQEVVVRLNGRGHLERRHVAALRVDAREDVADGPVFACGIHPLQHDQQATLGARIQDFLQTVDLLPVLVHGRLRVIRMLEAAGIVRGKRL